MMKIINISPTKIEDEKDDHWQSNCIYLSTKEKMKQHMLITLITAAIYDEGNDYDKG